MMVSFWSPSTHFNSRPSARGDKCPLGTSYRIMHISIHAPPRGATSPSPTFSIAEIFQFTPLREGRRWIVSLNTLAPIISIHAPPRGATESMSESTKDFQFQFTPLREGRLWCFVFSFVWLIFQFTPLREGRHEQEWETYFPGIFQFTPLREGRRLVYRGNHSK